MAGRQSDQRQQSSGRLSPPADLQIEYEPEPNNLPPVEYPGVSERVPHDVESEIPDAVPGPLRPFAPRFSWRVESDERGWGQQAYRILVASSREQLTRAHGDLWDSGMVASSNSTAVEYDSEPLAPDEIYYWTVRIRDDEGRLSEFGDPRAFSTSIRSVPTIGAASGLAGTKTRRMMTMPLKPVPCSARRSPSASLLRRHGPTPSRSATGNCTRTVRAQVMTNSIRRGRHLTSLSSIPRTNWTSSSLWVITRSVCG